MDKELIEQTLQAIHEETRKLINDAYICGYKDGYLECVNQKGRTQEIEQRKNSVSISLSRRDI